VSNKQLFAFSKFTQLFGRLTKEVRVWVYRSRYKLDRLCTCYIQVIYRLYTGYIQVYRLYTGYIQVIYKLYTGIQVIYRLYTGIQVIYRLYTGYIQVIYRLYTGYIQVIYRLYTGYIQVYRYAGYIQV